MITLLAQSWGLFVHNDERGADAIEYLLTIGVVMVALVVAVTAGLPGTLVTDLIAAVKTAVLGTIG